MGTSNGFLGELPDRTARLALQPESLTVQKDLVPVRTREKEVIQMFR